jgi:hypothetical protein
LGKLDDKVVQTSKLPAAVKTEVQKADVVSAMTSTLDNAKVTAILDKLTDKVVKTSQLETPAVAGKILGAKDGKKSILVEKLGGFLPGTDEVYEGKGAKAFLESKSLGSSGPGPSAEDLVTAAIGRDPNFISNVTSMAVADNLVFQGAVRGVMSKPSFEIPSNSNEPLSWDWQIEG